MNSTSGVSGLTGGNLLDPPEPVLSPAEWGLRYGPYPVARICNPVAPTGFSDWTISEARRVHAAHAERARAFLAMSDQPYPDDRRIASAVSQVVTPGQRRRALTGIVKRRVEDRETRRSVLHVQRNGEHDVPHE